MLLNAPLQDPVKYKIMGYEVSLRRSEADNIEVVSIEEAKEMLKDMDNTKPQYIDVAEGSDTEMNDKMLMDAAMKKRKVIRCV